MRPLLFVDVDGVLDPYAAPSCPDGFAEHDLFPGEEPVRLCADHGGWLQELAGAFDLVWGTGWNAADRNLLVDILDLPPFGAAVTLPAGRFDARERWRRWPATGRWRPAAGDRPLAIGLARADVDALIGWTEAYTRSL